MLTVFNLLTTEVPEIYVFKNIYILKEKCSLTIRNVAKFFICSVYMALKTI